MGAINAQRAQKRKVSPSDERRRSSRALKPREDASAADVRRAENREFENRTMAAREHQPVKRSSHRKGSDLDSLKPENEKRDFDKRAKRNEPSDNRAKVDRRGGKGAAGKSKQ
ncbi:MAG: hypothetical protein ACPGVN_03385 [Alphaproteobacteria bacterium]